MDFTEFYKKNYRMAFFFTIRRIVNVSDSEDILADSFLALYQVWGKIEDNNYKNYFFRILQNQINNYFRKKYQFEWIGSDDEFMEYKEYEYYDRTSKLKSFLKEKVEMLTEKDQHYYKLKYQKNLSITEIAKILSISINNVKIINNRLIKKLKKLCQISETI